MYYWLCLTDGLALYTIKWESDTFKFFDYCVAYWCLEGCPEYFWLFLDDQTGTIYDIHFFWISVGVDMVAERSNVSKSLMIRLASEKGQHLNHISNRLRFRVTNVIYIYILLRFTENPLGKFDFFSSFRSSLQGTSSGTNFSLLEKQGKIWPKTM